MSGSTVLAWIRAAFEALPDGTPQERTQWIKQRQRAVGAQPPITRSHASSSPSGEHDRRVSQSRGPKPFSHVADDPAVVRTGGDK